MHMERWSTLRHLLRYVGATESAKGEREREREHMPEAISIMQRGALINVMLPLSSSWSAKLRQRRFPSGCPLVGAAWARA